VPSVQHLSAWLAQQGSSPRPLQVYVTGQNKKSPQKNPLSLSLSLCLFLSLSLFFINCDTDSAVASLCQPTHVKRDLVHVKRDLVHVKRDLVHTDSAVASPCHSFTTGPPPQGGDLVNLNLTPYLNPTPYTLNLCRITAPMRRPPQSPLHYRPPTMNHLLPVALQRSMSISFTAFALNVPPPHHHHHLLLLLPLRPPRHSPERARSRVCVC